MIADSLTTTGPLPTRYATAGELAARFHTSREYWRQLAARGRIRAFKLSPKKTLYDLDEAEALVAGGQVRGAATAAE